MKKYLLTLGMAGIWLAAGCGSDEKPEILQRLPCVESLTVEKKEPLHIRVVTADGSGGVFIRAPGGPKVLSDTADVFLGQAFAVYEGRTGYDFRLDGLKEGMISLTETVVESAGVPQTKTVLVKPYGTGN